MSYIDLLDLKTVDDLYRVVKISRIVTATARAEHTKILNNFNGDVKDLVAQQIALIKNYANHPSFSEFSGIQGLELGVKWGSSFGVDILIRDILLSHGTLGFIRNLNTPRGIHLFLSFLKFATEGEESVLKVLRSSLACNIDCIDKIKAQGIDVSIFLDRLLEETEMAFISLAHTYGLISPIEGSVGANFTPLGARVFIHMQDMVTFRNRVATAHERLAKSRPSMLI